MFGSEEKTNNVNLEIKGSGNQTVILVTIKRKTMFFILVIYIHKIYTIFPYFKICVDLLTS